MKNFRFLLTLIMIATCMIFSSLSVFAEDEGVVGTENLNNMDENSAKVGDVLKLPEKGWKRYDDTNNAISYEGNFTKSTTTSYYTWENTLTTTRTPNDKIKFNFTGSKLRLRMYGNGDTSGFDLKIDGISKGNFKTYYNIASNLLVYDNSNLSNGEHSVEITCLDEATFPLIDTSITRIVLDSVDIDENGELLPYNENPTPINKFVLDVEPEDNKIKVGQEIELDVTIDNVKDIFAEDMRIKYDSNLLEYVGSTALDNIKIVDEEILQAGELRFIVGSKGEANAITSKTKLFKLKFRAKDKGETKVDITRGRVATIEKEWDLTEEQCGDTTIIIEGIKDVNRSGEFTLVDLAVDLSYYGLKADETDKTKYDTDIVADNEINDLDLVAIAKAMKENTKYDPNKY